MTIGKDGIKKTIERFGRVVTIIISGATYGLVVGKNLGVKKKDEAEKQEMVIMTVI